MATPPQTLAGVPLKAMATPRVYRTSYSIQVGENTYPVELVVDPAYRIGDVQVRMSPATEPEQNRRVLVRSPAIIFGDDFAPVVRAITTSPTAMEFLRSDEAATRWFDTGFDVPGRMREQVTAKLLESIPRGNLVAAAIYLFHDADVDAVVDESGVSPIHLAAATLDERMISLLVAHGADITRRTRDGHLTPSGVAAQYATVSSRYTAEEAQAIYNRAVQTGNDMKHMSPMELTRWFLAAAGLSQEEIDRELGPLSEPKKPKRRPLAEKQLNV